MRLTSYRRLVLEARRRTGAATWRSVRRDNCYVLRSASRPRQQSMRATMACPAARFCQTRSHRTVPTPPVALTNPKIADAPQTIAPRRRDRDAPASFQSRAPDSMDSPRQFCGLHIPSNNSCARQSARSNGDSSRPSATPGSQQYLPRTLRDRRARPCHTRARQLSYRP